MTRERTLADDLRHEDDLLRRRFISHTRPKRPLTMDEARELCERTAGADGETLSEAKDGD